MNARLAIKLSIDLGSQVSLGYLEDLTDAEMFRRPCAGCNHINWQVGHLIASEHDLIEAVAPGSMPPLPAGFKERYTNDTATSDDPTAFCTKAQLMEAFHQQRAGTLAAMERATDADFDKPSGFDWSPTVGSIYSLQGGHWLMHAGQWAVVRRMLGRKPLF
jgi:hypothetical protein